MWVVNTVFTATASSADGKSSPCPTSTRMRSSSRKAAWPSFMCHTVGLTPSAASARTPPTPSTISCSMRVVRSPPYSR